MGSIRADGRLRFLVPGLSHFLCLAGIEKVIAREQRSTVVQHLLSCTIALDRLPVRRRLARRVSGVLREYACRPDRLKRKSLIRH